MEELVTKLVSNGTSGLLVLAIIGIVFQWREIREQSKVAASLLEKSTVSIATLSGSVTTLTASIETLNRANEARLDTLKNMVANGEAQEKIMGFMLDELRRGGRA